MYGRKPGIVRVASAAGKGLRLINFIQFLEGPAECIGYGPSHLSEDKTGNESEDDPDVPALLANAFCGYT